MDSHPCISILHSSMHDGVVENPKDEILGFFGSAHPFQYIIISIVWSLGVELKLSWLDKFISTPKIIETKFGLNSSIFHSNIKFICHGLDS